jgi:cardiolipin synthase
MKLNPLKKGIPLRLANQASILRSGDEYFEKLIHQIKESKYEIQIQVYIFHDDEIGKRIIHELILAAKRGVLVYLLLDDYGSQELTQNSLISLQKAGVRIRKYAPFRKSFFMQMGLRLHHKIIVIDRKWATCGGINLADHYCFLKNDKTWLDFAFEVEGEIVLDLLKVCNRYWKNIPYDGKIPTINVSTELPMKVIENNWFRSRLAISHYYKTQIRTAKKEIVIVAGYFLPDPVLKGALKRAARRGVKVKIILGGNSDINLMQNAIRFFYSDLLKAGVELFEWDKSVLHAKLAMFDGKSMTIGSYNLISLSDYGSIECNLVSESPVLYKSCSDILDGVIQEACRAITTEEFEKSQSIFIRIKNRLSYYVLSVGLKLIFMLQNPLSNNEEELVDIEKP